MKEKTAAALNLTVHATLPTAVRLGFRLLCRPVVMGDRT